MGRAGRGVQLVRVGQPLLFGPQFHVLPRERLQPFDLGQPAAQVLALLGPLARQPGQFLQLAADVAVPLVGPVVVGGDRGQRRPGEAVQRLTLPGRAQQLLLVGLPVHRDQVIGEVGEQ